MKSKSFFLGLACFLCLLSFAQTKLNKVNAENSQEFIQTLSKCMEEKGAVMYGGKKCSHCEKQKALFGTEFKRFKFVDCSSNRKLCREVGVGPYPHWTFNNGKSIGRPRGGSDPTLSDLARVSGCKDYLAVDNSETFYSEPPEAEELFGTPADLAKCLKQKGVIFFGSPNCSHCNKQKAMFQGAFEEYLYGSFHNCKGTSSEKETCRRNKTYPFPTWLEPSTGKKLTGPERELSYIASYFGCNQFSERYPRIEGKNEIVKPARTPEILPTTPVTPSRSQQESERYSSDLNSGETLNLERINKCLKEKNVIFYGVMTLKEDTLPSQVKATKIQLEELGPIADVLDKVDCSFGTKECEGISVFPTWSLNQRELVGIYGSKEILETVGCN